MAIYLPSPKNINAAGRLIRQGELVAFATETVYGLGANAFDSKACEKIFKAKCRPHYDPLIVHVGSLRQLTAVAAGLTDQVIKMLFRFWPGPLTAVLKKQAHIPNCVTADLETVAVRIPSHDVALALIKAAGVPIAAPSANPFGYLSPTTAQHVEEQLGDKIEMILNGGPCNLGLESTIIDFTKEVPELLRHGGIPREDIESICGPIVMGQAILEQPIAPGQLASHYSPETKLVILKAGQEPDRSLQYGVLTHSSLYKYDDARFVEVVSSSGDFREAAHNLFAALHRLDKQKLDIIYAYEFPEEELGAAIMDRLRKAAVKSISKTVKI